MFRNDLYMHQRDSIRFALFLMTLDSRVRAQRGARGQDLGHLIFFFFFFFFFFFLFFFLLGKNDILLYI